MGLKDKVIQNNKQELANITKEEYHFIINLLSECQIKIKDIQFSYDIISKLMYNYNILKNKEDNINE